MIWAVSFDLKAHRIFLVIHSVYDFRYSLYKKHLCSLMFTLEIFVRKDLQGLQLSGQAMGIFVNGMKYLYQH